ncbi:Hypothetical protein GLP15_4612 [Giardia lamblia P15]|uniref:Uncharacterized protein n=1 Tax=Giardia intestinalis (strain P15) TaxID=658858 RepID=E1F7N8_GIAIA|nr:Hypothetical protein GLP15_4612 [Giardia lamblia P15]
MKPVITLNQFLDDRIKAQRPPTRYDKLMLEAEALVLQNGCTFGPGEGDCLINLFVSQILSQQTIRGDTITSFFNYIAQSYKIPNFVSFQSYRILFKECSNSLTRHFKIAARLIYLLTNILHHRSAAILSFPNLLDEIACLFKTLATICFTENGAITTNHSLIKTVFSFYMTLPTRLQSICPFLWTNYISLDSLPCRMLTITLLSAYGECRSRTHQQHLPQVDQHVIASTSHSDHLGDTAAILALKALSSYLRGAEQCMAAAECSRADRLNYTPYSQLLGSSLVNFYGLLESCFREIMESSDLSPEFVTAYLSMFRLFWTTVSPSKLHLDISFILLHTEGPLAESRWTFILSMAGSVLSGLKREILRRNYVPSKDSNVLIPLVQSQIPLFITVSRKVLSLLDSIGSDATVECEQELFASVEYLATFFGIFPVIGHFAELFPFIPSLKICFTEDGANIPLSVLRRLTLHDPHDGGTRLSNISWLDCQLCSYFGSAVTVDLLHVLNITSFTASGEPISQQDYTVERDITDTFMGCHGHRKKQHQAVAIVPTTPSQDNTFSASQPYLFVHALIRNELLVATQTGAVSITKEMPFSFLNSALDEVLGTLIMDQLLMCSIFLLKNAADVDTLLKGMEVLCLLSKFPLYYLEELPVADMFNIFQLSLRAVDICIKAWPSFQSTIATLAQGDEKAFSTRLVDLFAHSVSSYCHLLESDVISKELSRDEEELAIDREATTLISTLLSHSNYPTKVHCKVVIGIMALLRRHESSADAQRVLQGSDLLLLSLKFCQNQNRLQGYMIRIIRFLFMRITLEAIQTNSILGLPLNTTLYCILDGLMGRDRICFNSISSLNALFTRLGELDFNEASSETISQKNDMVSRTITQLASQSFFNRITPANGGIVIQLITLLGSIFSGEYLKNFNPNVLELIFNLAVYLSSIISQLQQYQKEAKRHLRKLVISLAIGLFGKDAPDPPKSAITILSNHRPILLEHLAADQTTLSFHLHDAQKRVDRLQTSSCLEHSYSGTVEDTQLSPISEEKLEQLGLCSIRATATDIDRATAMKSLARIKARYNICSAMITRLYEILGIAEGTILEL